MKKPIRITSAISTTVAKTGRRNHYAIIEKTGKAYIPETNRRVSSDDYIIIELEHMEII